ncbi:MAG: type IV pilin [Halorhabdus sp.]
MNLKTYLLDDDRGVSPVIGVILMVAITVILAAVIATFVMNMGPSGTGPANAQLEWTNKETGGTTYYELSMTGGEAMTTANYQVKITASGSSFTKQLDASPASGTAYTELTAGDSVYFTFASSASSNVPDPEYTVSLTASNVEEVQIIWQSPDSDKTQVVDTWSP